MQCQFSQVYFDSHAYGVKGDAGLDMTFTNCWFSGRPGSGVLIAATDAACDSWTFDGCRGENCGTHGAVVNPSNPSQNPVSNIGFVGCDFISNYVSLQMADEQPGNGLTLHNVTQGVRVVGCRCYNSPRFGFAGKQAYGIYIDVNCNYYLVVGNDVRGHNPLKGGLFDGNKGANKIVKNNLNDGPQT
jgi:hypothetical protein